MKAVLDVSEDVKKLVSEVKDTFDNRYEHQYQMTSVDDDKLSFRICTSSGTKINIPSNILRDALIAGTIFIATKIVLETIDLILSNKK